MDNQKKMKNDRLKEQYRINERIRVPEVRLVGDNVTQGVYPIERALQIAEAQEMDLVEISPNTNPPVYKITDYQNWPPCTRGWSGCGAPWTPRPRSTISFNTNYTKSYPQYSFNVSSSISYKIFSISFLYLFIRPKATGRLTFIPSKVLNVI